jgi:hypothetical protein
MASPKVKVGDRVQMKMPATKQGPNSAHGCKATVRYHGVRTRISLFVRARKEIVLLLCSFCRANCRKKGAEQPILNQTRLPQIFMLLRLLARQHQLLWNATLLHMPQLYFLAATADFVCH